MPQAERDALTSSLIDQANEKIHARDFDGAIAKCEDAFRQKPSPQILGLVYRALGTVSAYKGDTRAAVKWFKLYKPLAVETPEERERSSHSGCRIGY